MDLHEAWRVFGEDLSAILREAKSRRREERLQFLESLLEEAKKTRTALLARHHPDKGGDPVKFKRVGEAFQVIEKGTADFREKLVNAGERESSKSVRIVIDPLK